MTVRPTLRRCGERAVLLEVDDLDGVLATAGLLRDLVSEGQPAVARVVDIVPAARTVLVTLDDDSGTAELDRLWHSLGALDVTVDPARVASGGAAIRILVHYDGPDLAEIAELTGLTADAVVEAHQATPWRAAFGGFAPGFAYLTGGDPRLRVPRRSDPRTSVPAGAVGLAGEFSAVYPRSSPGGWQLLGHTEAELWNSGRAQPALLVPGAEVHFVDADADGHADGDADGDRDGDSGS